MTLDTRAAVQQGAVAGILAWLAYAVVEGTFLVVIPWLASPAHLYKQPHPGLTLLSWASYVLAGCITGAVAGLVASRLSSWCGSVSVRDATRELTALSLLAVAAGCLWFVSPPQRSVWVGLAVALTFTGWQVARALGSGAVASPGASVVALAIVGSAWVVNDLLWFFSVWVRLAGMLGLVVSCVAGCLALRTVFHSTWVRALEIPATPAFLARASALSLLFIAGNVLVQKPLERGVDRHDPVDAIQDKPPVILIVMDTTRADHLSVYGYARPTARRLEEFAEDSLVFDAAVSPSSFTLPSHASMFTGLYPSQHGSTSMRRPLGEGFTTVAEILRDLGYATTAVVANVAYLRPTLGLSQGFDYYDSREPLHFLAGFKPYLLRAAVGRFARMTGALEEEPHYTRGATITREALQQIEVAAKRGGPFLLFVNYMDSHDPYLPPTPYDDMFPGRDLSFDWGPKNRSSRWALLTPPERKHVVSQYDGAVAYVDAQIGSILRTLRDHGLYEGSLIIVVGDHGEALGRRDYWGHGSSLYQDQVHVPLLIKLPFGRHKGEVPTTVSTVDLFYTILQITGASLPTGAEGRSLVGPMSKSPYVLAEHSVEEYGRVLESKRAVYKDDLKLIRHSSGANELYDLRKDPLEMHNIYPSRAAALESVLAAWEQSIRKGPSPTFTLDPDTVESLRSLGYVQ